MLTCLIYGLTISSDTISNNMIINTPYRIVISTCIVLQMSILITCMYTKRCLDPDTATWGLFSAGVTAGSWVGLSIILSGTPHIVFVVLFLSSFMMDILIMCNLTWQRRAVNILVTCIAFMLVCLVAMVILFNNRQFYIMEHVGMITYSIIFTAFFLEHTPDAWGELEEECYGRSTGRLYSV